MEELITRLQPHRRWYHRLMFWRKAPSVLYPLPGIEPLVPMSGFAIQQLLEAAKESRRRWAEDDSEV